MDTSSYRSINDFYRERLEQAVRVMEGLTETQRAKNFDINCIVRDSEDGIVACIAGWCGLDPWFQERGFITDIDYETISTNFGTFFGTERPFFASEYNLPRPITVDDAIAALKAALEELPNSGSVYTY